MADQVQVITAQIKVEDAPLNKLVKTIQEGGADAKVLEAALAAAGIEMADLGKAAEKATKASTEGFKSLKQQLRDARNEATLLSQKFGENSQQALAATKRVAQLTEELDDFNQRVKALNPEAKFNSVQNALQGVFGALQGVTGALQLFGAENKQVEEAAKRLQGALNLAQGINSVLGLKDAFGNLRTVLGLTTAAQSAAATAAAATTAATEAEAVAAGQAAVATKGFTAALVANPITAVVVALAALVSGILIYNAASEDSTEITEEQTKALEEQAKAQEELAKRYESASKSLKDQIEDQRIKTALSLKQIDDLQAKLQQNNLNRIRAQRDNEFKKDAETIANINKLFGLREQEIRAEAEKAKKVEVTKKITDELIKSMQTLGLVFKEEILTVSDDSFTRIQDILRLVSADAFKVKEDLVKINKELAKIAPEYTKISGSATQLNQELFAKNDARIAKSAEIAFGLAQESFAFVADLSAQSTQRQQQDLERQKAQGLITEEQYQEKLKKIEIDAARRQKELAIFSATVAFAEALVKALTTPNPPASLILASAVGGLNLAKIIAQPIPKFKQGTLNFAGGNMDADGGSLAMLHPGEAVIPQDRNRMYAPAIRAIFNKQISPREINAFVQNKLGGKLESRVTADVDTYGLARAMSRNKGVQIENARVVGKAIASEIANRVNRRQML